MNAARPIPGSPNPPPQLHPPATQPRDSPPFDTDLSNRVQAFQIVHGEEANRVVKPIGRHPLPKQPELCMSETNSCPFCESEIGSTAKKCRHCGEWVSRDCLKCGTPIKSEWAARGFCADCGGLQTAGSSVQPMALQAEALTYPGAPKNRGAAVALALILGGVGAHKFYLDRPGLGLLYLVFFWTLIPAIAGFVEGILYATMSEEEFQHKFPGGRY